MKITIVSSEAVPFAKTGGLADVVTALGKELVELGNEVTVMLPFYQGIHIIPTSVTGPLSLTFAGRHISYSILESVHEGVHMVFVDAPNYFQRSGIYGDLFGSFGDNDERFIFFTRACIDYYKRRGDRPDVFHCNDWPTGLFSLFLRTHYYHDQVSYTPVLFTIHNIAYQGTFPRERYALLELGGDYFTADSTEFFGTVSFLKAGILYSDLLTTVSKRYSYEIQTPEYGYRMDGVLRRRADRLFGVLNGIDDDHWNPQTDHLIARNYSINDLSGKDDCRLELLASAELNSNTVWPVIGIISRLASQKGFDLLESAGERILDMGTKLVVLGSGEHRYEQYFHGLRARRPHQVAVAMKFDNVLAHKIEAGADMFLMPSHYEPCGLNQMYSLRYGTIPVVRATGGLDDTVQEWDWNSSTGSGFKFYDYNADALLGAVWRARSAFENKDAWRKLQLNGMRGNYSWRSSALQYMGLYEQAVHLK